MAAAGMCDTGVCLPKDGFAGAVVDGAPSGGVPGGGVVVGATLRWLSWSGVVLVLLKSLYLIARLALHLNLKLKMSKDMVGLFGYTFLMVL